MYGLSWKSKQVHLYSLPQRLTINLPVIVKVDLMIRLLLEEGCNMPMPSYLMYLEISPSRRGHIATYRADEPADFAMVMPVN